MSFTIEQCIKEHKTTINTVHDQIIQHTNFNSYDKLILHGHHSSLHQHLYNMVCFVYTKYMASFPVTVLTRNKSHTVAMKYMSCNFKNVKIDVW